MTLSKGLPPVAAVIVALTLASCTSLTPEEIVDPKDVTVSEALKDIGLGFQQLRHEMEDEAIGVYACKIEIDLNVKASANEKGSLVLDLATEPRQLEGISTALDPAVKAKAEQTNEADAERGNKIKIEMYNPACLPNNTLGYNNPDKIGLAMKGMAITEDMLGSTFNLQNVEELQPVSE